jgi:hypothetical protein
VKAPHLRAIDPEANPEEVAAIVAALALLGARSVDKGRPADELHEWVRVARLRSRRTGLQRGPWRMSSRVARSRPS